MLMDDDESYTAPRLSLPLELETHIRELPRDASCRGVYCQDILRQASARCPADEVMRRAKIEPQRWIPFRQYAYADFLRLVAYTGDLLYPSLEPGDRVRRLGRGVYDALLSIQIGRTLFGSLGSQFDLVGRLGARGWGVSLNFGTLVHEEVGPRHFRYHFRDMPAFLETFQVGVVEGAMKLCNVRGVVKVKPVNLGTLSMNVRWVEDAR